MLNSTLKNTSSLRVENLTCLLLAQLPFLNPLMCLGNCFTWTFFFFHPQKNDENGNCSGEGIEFPTTNLYELESRVLTDHWSIPYKREESLGKCLIASTYLARLGKFPFTNTLMICSRGVQNVGQLSFTVSLLLFTCTLHNNHISGKVVTVNCCTQCFKNNIDLFSLSLK